MNGKKLRKLRENSKLFQKDISKDLNISTSTIGMYEQGRREPDNSTLKKIANYFGVSTDYLLDNEKKNAKEDEIREREALRKVLIKAGYMEENEDLTDDELKRLIKFVNKNKEFIKGEKC